MTTERTTIRTTENGDETVNLTTLTTDQLNAWQTEAAAAGDHELQDLIQTILDERDG